MPSSSTTPRQVYVVLQSEVNADGWSYTQYQDFALLGLFTSPRAANQFALQHFDRTGEPYEFIRCRQGGDGLLKISSKYLEEGESRIKVWVEERSVSAGEVSDAEYRAMKKRVIDRAERNPESDREDEEEDEDEDEEEEEDDEEQGVTPVKVEAEEVKVKEEPTVKQEAGVRRSARKRTRRV
jgi:hypothetical protein